MKRFYFFAAALLLPVAAAAQISAEGKEIFPDNDRFYYVTQETHPDSVREFRMENIEVHATRANSRTPVAYSEVGREQIAKMNYGQDIPYLLTLTPSVVATSDAGAGIGYTGIRIRGVDATRINVTSNGVPMNDAESHGMFWVNVPDIASSTEDIQIQRGVGTSTNGAGAFGGSINIKTESPAMKPYAEAAFSYGSYNTYKASAKVHSGLLRDRWAFSARLSRLHSDGYIQRASTDLKSWFAQGGYYGDKTVVKLLVFGGNERTYHAWDGIDRHMMDSIRNYNPCGEIVELVRDDIGRPLLDENGKRQYKAQGKYYDNQIDSYSQNHFQLILNQHLAPKWRLNATLHYTLGSGYYEEYKNGVSLVEYGLEPFKTPDANLVDYIATDSYGVPLPPDRDGNYIVDRSDIIRRKKMENGFGGAIINVSYTGRRLSAIAGASGNRYAGEHFGPVLWVKDYVGMLDPAHEYYRNETDKRDYNIFARANYEIVKGLSIYADLQWRTIRHRIWGVNDKYDWRTTVQAMQPLDVDKQYHFFNPKAGIFYSLKDKHVFYASFAAAHKEPTRNNFTDVLNGAAPKPEQLFDYELGYGFRGRIFSAGVNLYYMDYNDQLVLTGQTNEIGEAMSANVAKSYRAGVELTAGVQITDWLRWDLNATLSRNIIRNYTEYIDTYDAAWEYTGQSAVKLGDVPIAYSPSIIAGSLISVNVGGFGASFQSQYVGSQYVTNTKQDGVWDDAAGDWSLDPLKLDDYFVSNLRLDYTFMLKSIRRLSVGVAVNNIFNARYCSNGWGYSYQVDNGSGGFDRINGMGYYPQATINVMGNVTIRF